MIIICIFLITTSGGPNWTVRWSALVLIMTFGKDTSEEKRAIC